LNHEKLKILALKITSMIEIKSKTVSAKHYLKAEIYMNRIFKYYFSVAVGSFTIYGICPVLVQIYKRLLVSEEHQPLVLPFYVK
jgi:hypothetical protein